MGRSKNRSKRNAKRDALYALNAQQLADDYQKWKWYYYVGNAIIFLLFLLLLPFCIVFAPVEILVAMLFPQIPHDAGRYPHLYTETSWGYTYNRSWVEFINILSKLVVIASFILLMMLWMILWIIRLFKN